MKTVYHLPLSHVSAPKRGDILQSNIGDRRERTWLIIGVRQMTPKFCPEMGYMTDRFRVWAERWWEIEPEMRVMLFRSAERAGGQLCHSFSRFKPKRKRTFEEFMREPHRSALKSLR